MIEIKYNTRVYIDKKTNRVMIRARWNGQEVCFALDCRADSTKWDGKAQRPMAGTVHKFEDQNCTSWTSYKSSLVLIINTYRLFYCISDTFMFPNFWQVKNRFQRMKKGREKEAKFTRCHFVFINIELTFI